jgi:hypothetical protein
MFRVFWTQRVLTSADFTSWILFSVFTSGMVGSNSVCLI